MLYGDFWNYSFQNLGAFVGCTYGNVMLLCSQCVSLGNNLKRVFHPVFSYKETSISGHPLV